MKKLLISLPLIACALTVSPVEAHPVEAADNLALELADKMYTSGRGVGWMQAACTYYLSGAIDSNDAKIVIKKITSTISSDASYKLAKGAVVGTQPACTRLFD